MKIPPKCQGWADEMKRGSNAENVVLRNMQDDSCLDQDVEDDFFNDLAVKGVPVFPSAAWRWAREVVEDKPNRYLCQGKEVPNDRFEVLVRFTNTRNMKYVLTQSEWTRLETTFGLPKNTPFERLDETRQSVVMKSIKGPLNLGTATALVWATENGAVRTNLSSLPKVPAQVIEDLGLDQFVGEEQCLVISYRRDKTRQPIHVPRILDAIGHPRFQPTSDCGAECGKTLPLSGVLADGLPEAIHRYCTVEPEEINLGSIIR